MGVITTDWLIGNSNTVIMQNFRDSWSGTIDNDVTAYLSICYAKPGTITNATWSGSSVITITSAAHGLTTGDIVTIVNIAGCGSAKGTWTVTVVDANTFTLNGSTGDGAYTGGGTFYKCVPSGDAILLPLAAAGTYVAEVAAELPLLPQTQYMLILYCLGTYRDLYNALISITARTRGSG